MTDAGSSHGFRRLKCPNLKGTLVFAAILWGGLFWPWRSLPGQNPPGRIERLFLGWHRRCSFLVVAPILGTGLPYPKRALFSLGLGVFSIAIWFGGLFTAGFKILCKLF